MRRFNPFTPVIFKVYSEDYISRSIYIDGTVVERKNCGVDLLGVQKPPQTASALISGLWRAV